VTRQRVASRPHPRTRACAPRRDCKRLNNSCPHLFLFDPSRIVLALRARLASASARAPRQPTSRSQPIATSRSGRCCADSKWRLARGRRLRAKARRPRRCEPWGSASKSTSPRRTRAYSSSGIRVSPPRRLRSHRHRHPRRALLSARLRALPSLATPSRPRSPRRPSKLESRSSRRGRSSRRARSSERPSARRRARSNLPRCAPTRTRPRRARSIASPCRRCPRRVRRRRRRRRRSVSNRKPLLLPLPLLLLLLLLLLLARHRRRRRRRSPTRTR
jgi:hypothetical protein